MEYNNKQNKYENVYENVIAHLEKKYPLISNRWRIGTEGKLPNLHVLPFALIQKGSYILKDLFEAICKDEGECVINDIFHNNLDYVNFLVGKTRKITTTATGQETEYVKSEYICNNANDPQCLLSYVQNAIVVVTIQLPTLKSIKRFVKGVKSIFGDVFWRCVDQTKIPNQTGEYVLTLQSHNRMRFAKETIPENTQDNTQDTTEITADNKETTETTEITADNKETVETQTEQSATMQS
jgi:hypothetical protein